MHAQAFTPAGSMSFAGAPAFANLGGEGVACAVKTGRFWVCSERSPMSIYSFPRPTDSAAATDEKEEL